MANSFTPSLMLMLLVLSLLALFPTDTQATNSLTEKYKKCESEFWFKNLSSFKKSLKSKCLKENLQYEKRHRQYHICDKKSHDKKAIFSKWEKFTDCRCDSAVQELKSKVKVCYQIVRFNKATGKFIGQVSIYKKESDKNNYGVAVKFSHDLKLLNHNGKWSKSKDGYYFSKKVKKSNKYHKDGISVEKLLIPGKISKKESLNKNTFDRITPSNFLLLNESDDKSSTVIKSLKKNEISIVPFNKFGFDNIAGQPFGHAPPTAPPKNSLENNPISPENPLENAPPTANPKNPLENAPPTANPKNPLENAPPTANPENSQENAPPTANPENSPENTPPTAPEYSPEYDTPPSQPSSDGTGNNNNVAASSNSAIASSDNSATAKSDDGSKDLDNSRFIGLIAFVIIIAVGVAFVLYNTYERVKWRRHYRRRNAARQNVSNVPDYNGYGRAY